MQTNSAPPSQIPPRQRDSRGHFIPRSRSATSQPVASAAKPITTGPRSLDSTPPVLSLFRHGAIAVLRIHDLAFSSVVSAVVQSLPADVESLMLVTPTDTKMFAVNAAAGGSHDARKVPSTNRQEYRSVSEATEQPDGHTQDDTDYAEDPQAEAIREAAEGDRDAVAAGLETAEADINLAETPAARRKAMNERRRLEESPASDPCGRCGGSGTMQVALPDGGASQAACPVCRGSGKIRRFGVRH